MAHITQNNSQAKARQAMLEIAKKWDKQGKVQHAIESYEAVIEAAPESKEAQQAQDALMEIARKFEQSGEKHSAYFLYHKLASGRAARHTL